MAYKEVFRVEIAEVIRQRQAGRGIRETARSTGLARNTVRKYFLTAQSCGLVRDGSPPTESQLLAMVQLNKAGPRHVVVPTNEVLEPWADQIEQWLKQDKLKLTRVQELLAGLAVPDILHVLASFCSQARLGKTLTDESAHGRY